MILFRATEIIWATAKVYLTMRDGHLRPEVFYATNQMKKKPNLDKIVKYLPNTRISSKKYKIDNQVGRFTKKTFKFRKYILVHPISTICNEQRIPTGYDSI